jgi:hypothetical protein
VRAIRPRDRKVLWERVADRRLKGGPVPGTAVVIGHTVYTSSFKTRDAIGIDVRSHRKTFSLRQAGYTPVVSDGRRLYAIGYFELIGLQPTR